MREDRQFLMLTHLSQLLNLFTGIGGLVAPLVIWLTQKEQVVEMDFHGKKIMNFQISMLIYSLLSVPLIFLFGLGIILLIAIAVIVVVFPILNGIKASHRQPIFYPFSYEFLR